MAAFFFGGLQLAAGLVLLAAGLAVVIGLLVLAPYLTDLI